MKAVELVKINRIPMEMMSKYGIKQDDWRYLQMYEEYVIMRERREKFRYIMAHLAEVYEISESSVKRVVRRLSSEVKV